MGKVKHHKLIASRTEFFYYAFRNILLVGLPLFVISGLVLSHSSFHSSATSSGTDSFTVSISSACTLGSVVDSEHNIETNVGTYVADVGKTTITTLCNDGNGYSVYAVGYSNNEEGNNKLINSEYPQYSIDTGLATSGLTSAWAMKLNNIPDDPSPTPPAIASSYDNTYGIAPNYWTKVASRSSGTTDMNQGSSFTATYSIYTSSSQHAGTYVGQVKFLLVHSSYKPTTFYMQDIAKWGNELIPNIGDSIIATDKRDYKSYYITRLADGHIWMTQNLAIDLGEIDNAGNVTMRTFTSEDTDLNVFYDESNNKYAEYSDGYNSDPTTNVISWTPISNAATIKFTGTIISSWKGTSTKPASATKTDGPNTGHKSLGNYYNWNAAIASNNSSAITSGNAINSICPKGWRLPNITTAEFATINNLYNNGSTTNGTNLTISPLWFVQSGYLTGSLSSYETRGLYWSSTTNGGSNAPNLDFSNNSVNTNSYTLDRRERGFSVRCIAR